MSQFPSTVGVVGGSTSDPTQGQPSHAAGRKTRSISARARRSIVNAVIRLAIVVAAIGLWGFLVEREVLDSFSVSSPGEVWASLKSFFESGEIAGHVGATLKEASLGYVLGCAVGIPLGFAFAIFPRVGEIFKPFVTVLNSLPRLALAPLFIFWFGIGSTSKVALVFSLVIFILLVNTFQGAASVDDDIRSLSRTMGVNRLQFTRKVMLPTAVPWIIAGMRLSIAYALAGAVVGEMFSSQQGIGFLIMAGSGVLNMGDVFAAIVIIMVIAAAVEMVAERAERHLLRWRAPTR